MQRKEQAVKPAADTLRRQPAPGWTTAPEAPSAVVDERPQAVAQRESLQSIWQRPVPDAWRALKQSMHTGPRMVAQRQVMMAAFGAAAAQRQPDTHSSPALPDYGPDEIPAWKGEQGVPQWAKEAYIEESALTLIASISGGKIGSVYFPEGRIRTTHTGGPRASAHKGSSTLQFNVDHAAANLEFETQDPNARSEVEADAARELGSSKRTKRFELRCKQLYASRRRRWLANRLTAASLTSLPPWAVAVTSPQTAVDLDVQTPSKDTALFEIFVSVSGKVEGWHPSRGVAARFATDKQVVSVLKAALAQLEVDGVIDPNARNKAFYAFIKSRLPKFVSNIRAPDEV